MEELPRISGDDGWKSRPELARPEGRTSRTLSRKDSSELQERPLLGELADWGPAVEEMTVEELEDEVLSLRREVMRQRKHKDSDRGTDELNNFLPRAVWLVGLLFFQSTSSFVLQYFSAVLEQHPALMYFLTMLVGAGGNAGGQSAVLVIRELALAKEHGHHVVQTWRILSRQLWMALRVSVLLTLVSYIRCHVFQGVATQESLAIASSMLMIVFCSILIGSLLPILLASLNIDPGHAGAAIQVIMDIMGVTLTCVVGTAFLRGNNPTPRSLLAIDHGEPKMVSEAIIIGAPHMAYQWRLLQSGPVDGTT
eukprot:GEMP01047299.1.p1 GENE.GEMP01047299.1~~GEMP01047299.1.p1  ORF type:complete len:310 (+),score=61.35 GEMP01047299.1:57-986(+)